MPTKPPHEQRYDDHYDDESTAQYFQLTMTMSDSNAVTTIRSTTYWKAVTIGRDEQDITLQRSCLQEVLFSIEVQDPIDGIKSKLLAASAGKHLSSRTLSLTMK
jgi:hypothetical protein